MIRFVVIADSSALMALENIGEIEVLPKLFYQITVTPEVAHEYGYQLPSWIRIQTASNSSLQRPEIGGLDPGEASSIAVALDSDNPLLIIDEKKGRKVAERLNIEIIGTIGVLIKARVAGLIENPDSLLSRLEAVDFRLDEILRSRLIGSEENLH